MGYYIEVPHPVGKAKQMVDIHSAELVLSPEKFDFSGDRVLLCVVENPLFDAIAVAFDASERDAFSDPRDNRPKTWLSIPRKLAKKLQPLAPI